MGAPAAKSDSLEYEEKSNVQCFRPYAYKYS